MTDLGLKPEKLFLFLDYWICPWKPVYDVAKEIYFGVVFEILWNDEWKYFSGEMEIVLLRNIQYCVTCLSRDRLKLSASKRTKKKILLSIFFVQNKFFFVNLSTI